MSLEECKIRELTGKELAETVWILSSSPKFLIQRKILVKELTVLYKYQIYTMGFSTNTNSVFIVFLKTEDFSISFSSIFNIIFHNFRARFVILHLLFVRLKEGTI